MSPFLRIAVLCFFLFQCIIPDAAHAQNKSGIISQTLLVSASNKSTLPYWLVSNKFGVIPRNDRVGLLRLSALAPFRENHPLNYRIGVDLLGRIANNSSVFFQQLYGEVLWGPFLLRIGRKEETAGHVHPTLSLGSMVLSANAAPITGISLSWPEYVAVPGTDGFLSIKGSLKHGWIDGFRITTNPWLHEKTMYLGLGKKDWVFQAWAGLLHATVWGGHHRDANIGDLPSSFNDYVRVFFGQGASEDFTGSDGEVINALGNSIGAYDFGFTVYAATVNVRVYRQFYVEDTVSLRFRNVFDGLWGAGVTFKKAPDWIQEILWEHVNTKRQGSRPADSFSSGTDNYYNNAVYATGWTHRGRTLGMPLIQTREGQAGVFNNILIAHHLGLKGSVFPSLAYRLLFTYSRNYGANALYDTSTFTFSPEGARFPEASHQYSLGVDLNKRISAPTPLNIFVRLGYDWGELLPQNNFGITVGVERISLF